MSPNFDTYFKKLNIAPENPSLKLVKALQKKHIATFSFNNIAVLLKQPISLEIEDIIKKIVTKNLGGYCFEHNALMYEALKSLGFNVRILIAKVVNNQSIDVPRTHRITLLEWEGEQYIVDVGFGSTTAQLVLNINDHAQKEGYRVVSLTNGKYQLEMKKDGAYFILYYFDLAEYTEADCIMGNFYSSTYPDAVFVKNFVISIIYPTLTLSFRNGIYHRISKNETEVITIQNLEHLHLIITNDFAIPLSLAQCKYLYELII